MWQELLDLRVGFRMQGKYGRYIQVGLGFGMRPQFFNWALGRGLASTIMHGLHVLALCYHRCSGDATGATAAVVSVLLLPSCADHCSERVIFVLAVGHGS